MAQAICNHDWHCHASREDYYFKFEDYICFACGATTFDVLDKRVLLPTLEEVLGRALCIALPVIIVALDSSRNNALSNFVQSTALAQVPGTPSERKKQSF